MLLLRSFVRLIAIVGIPVSLCSCGSALRVHRVAETGGVAPSPYMGANVLRIGTYNISHGRGNQGDDRNGGDEAVRLNRLQRLAEFLRDAKLDVVVLNEVDFDAATSFNVNQAALLASEGGFHYWVEHDLIRRGWFGLRRHRSGNAVLSRLPISRARRFRYHNDRLWRSDGDHKDGVLCDINLTHDQTFALLGLQLDDPDEASRIGSVVRVEAYRRAADIPMVVAGDFQTARPGDPQTDTSITGETAIGFLLRQSGFHTMPTGDAAFADFTFPAANPTRIVDWILIPEDWRFVGQTVADVQFSEHLPVIATVRVSTAK